MHLPTAPMPPSALGRFGCIRLLCPCHHQLRCRDAVEGLQVIARLGESGWGAGGTQFEGRSVGCQLVHTLAGLYILSAVVEAGFLPCEEASLLGVDALHGWRGKVRLMVRAAGCQNAGCACTTSAVHALASKDHDIKNTVKRDMYATGSTCCFWCCCCTPSPA